MTIINLKDINLNNITIPKHPCMPDISTITRESWAVIDDNHLLAICSLYTTDTPTFESYKTACIGNFFATDNQAGISLLNYACKQLLSKDFEYVIGPMNGDTWHSYRLVTEPFHHQPFFMEHFTPQDWPKIFTTAGFQTIAGYSSAKAEQINYVDKSADTFAAKINSLNITLRPFAINNTKAELTSVHQLSTNSFARNFLYTDINLSDFLALYEKIIPYVIPDFFLMAEHEGKLIGFAFAIPDYLQKQQGKEIDTLILKTIAVEPGRTYAGLGSYLFYKIHQLAIEKGFNTVIHAYMHDSNISKIISNKSAQTIRRYHLFGKKLTS